MANLSQLEIEAIKVKREIGAVKSLGRVTSVRLTERYGEGVGAFEVTTESGRVVKAHAFNKDEYSFTI